MTNYTTKDFSQIHPPEDKPVNVGWYPAYLYEQDAEFMCECPNSISDIHVYWWDGKLWRLGENDKVCIRQDRYWFGLREKQS